MISIFTTIQADLSPEFRQKCSNSVIDTESLLQKIGELTGAVLITGGETPKFVGSWNSVKNTYDILSGFLLYRSLLGVDKRYDVARGGVHMEENRRSVETFRYINSVYEREKTQVFSPDRTPNSSVTSNNVFQAHNAPLTNEHLFDETLRSRLVEKRQDFHITPQTRSFEGDCMDIEKLSAFYKEESQTSNPEHFTETEKPQNASYIHNVPAENSPIQNLLNNRNVEKTTRHMNYSINPKKSLAHMFHEVVHCDECSYSSYSKRNLLFHKARTHIRPYKCKHCGRGFGLMKDLRRHYQKKRDCKQYTFVKVRQVGDKTVEEPINLDSFEENENNFDADKSVESKQSISFENQQSTGETTRRQNIEENATTEMDNKREEIEKSNRAETVSILPLRVGESQKESNDRIQNENEVQENKVMVEDNDMYLKKKSDDENTFIVHINNGENKNNDAEGDDYCVVKINPDVDEGDTEVTENTENLSKTDLSVSENSAFTNQDQTRENEENFSNEKSEEVMSGQYPVEDAENSEGYESPHDTAVVDLSQFSLDSDENTDSHSNFDSPSTSFQTVKRHRKCRKKDLPYVVVHSEIPKGPELKMTFPCSYCDYSTHRLKLIDDHVKRVHFKKFECNQCGTRFGLKKDLNRHYRRTHKMDLELQRRGRRPVDNLEDMEMLDEQEDGSMESVPMNQETDSQM